MAGLGGGEGARPRLDLTAITASLRGGRATEAWLATWLPSTWGAGEAFAAEARAHLGRQRGAAFKSDGRTGHDPYHDAVAAHLGKRRVAVVSVEGGEVVRVGYDELHARCNALATAWVEAGVEAGQGVAIVGPAGLDLAVACLTAWRLGLLPSIVDPQGPAFVRDALARLGCEHVATSVRRKGLVAGAASALPVAAGVKAAGPGGSFTFAPGSPAARLRCPFGGHDAAGDVTPGAVEVDVGVLLDGAVRDAAFVFGLEADDVVAAPGFDLEQHEPALLLAALVAGAAWCALPLAELCGDPGLIKTSGVTVLGLAHASRDALVERGASLPSAVRGWFRSLLEITDPARWDAFHRAVPDRRQPGFGVVVAAAAGGACLFSSPSTAAPSTALAPAPGLAWQLTEPASVDVPALGDAGVFTVLRGEDPDPGFARVVVGRVGEGLAFGGSLDEGPHARAFAIGLLERVAEGVEGVRRACAFTSPGRRINEHHVTLVLFVERGAKPVVDAGAVERHVVRELGPALAPGRVIVAPLRPRLRDGVVDRLWCRSQYTTGALARKTRSVMFSRLARVGYLLAPEAASK